MKQNKHTPEPLVLEKGYFLEKHYDNYEMMEESAKNWTFHCTYQLKPNALSGYHSILQLDSMQLSHGKRPGGMMHNVHAALDTVSVSVIVACRDKACFHRTKLEVRDIMFSDASRPYNLITNDHIKFNVVNIPINILESYHLDLSQVYHHTIKDIDDIFLNITNEIWEQFTNNLKEKKDIETYKEAENKIISVIKKLLEAQTPKVNKLTKGEEITLAIRDQIYAHMDTTVSIESLAKQHKVSIRTLQKSFKSLFGFTPTLFLRQMKLNLVYRDLKYANVENENVSRVAHKWGFMHMGRFSRYYTELFGENPSQTLKTSYREEDIIVEECVERKEEI